jgi:hypothetical protein
VPGGVVVESVWDGGRYEAPPGFTILVLYVSPPRLLFHEIFDRSRIFGMRIQFERSGGFAGKKLEGSLDSSTLSVAQVRRLKELLRRSRFFELPPTLESMHPSADHFNYRLTIETGERKHTVEASETAVPAPMRALLDFLTRSLAAK